MGPCSRTGAAPTRCRSSELGAWSSAALTRTRTANPWMRGPVASSHRASNAAMAVANYDAPRRRTTPGATSIGRRLIIKWPVPSSSSLPATRRWILSSVAGWSRRAPGSSRITDGWSCTCRLPAGERAGRGDVRRSVIQPAGCRHTSLGGQIRGSRLPRLVGPGRSRCSPPRMSSSVTVGPSASGQARGTGTGPTRWRGASRRSRRCCFSGR